MAGKYKLLHCSRYTKWLASYDKPVYSFLIRPHLREADLMVDVW